MSKAKDEVRTPRNWKRWQKTLAVGGCILAVVGPLAWLVGEAMGVYHGADSTSEKSAALQAIAGLATLIATVALIVVTWWYAVITKGILRKSGPIITAQLRQGWADVHAGLVLTRPFDLRASSPEPRYTDFVIVINVRNSGNGSATIEGVSVKQDDGAEYSMTRHSFGPNVPVDLTGNTSVTFYLEPSHFIAGIKVFGKTAKPRAQARVTIGSGEVIGSPWEKVELRSS